MQSIASRLAAIFLCARMVSLPPMEGRNEEDSQTEHEETYGEEKGSVSLSELTSDTLKKTVS